MIDFLASLDNELTRAVAIWHGRSTFADQVIAWLADANVLKFVPLMAALCWLWFRADGLTPQRRGGVVLAVVMSFVALMVARAFALVLPFRARPFLQPELGLQLPAHAGFAGLNSWSSIPSDHAVMAFALAAGIWRLSRPLGVWAFAHAIVFICGPRFYFGLHFAGDMAAGALLGTLVVALAASWPPAVQASGWLAAKAEVPRYAAAFYSLGFLTLYQMGEMFNSLRMIVKYGATLLQRAIE